MGCERVRGKAKGGAVVSRPETRLDGYSSPREKKMVLQVSKVGLSYNNAGGRVGWECCIFSKYCNERSVNILKFLCAG